MLLKRSSFALLLSAALPVAAAAPPADGPADTRLPDMAARTGSQTLQVRGFRASDVGEHPQRGITPAHV